MHKGDPAALAILIIVAVVVFGGLITFYLICWLVKTLVFRATIGPFLRARFHLATLWDTVATLVSFGSIFYPLGFVLIIPAFLMSFFLNARAFTPPGIQVRTVLAMTDHLLVIGATSAATTIGAGVLAFLIHASVS